jgi:hypothetical protein
MDPTGNFMTTGHYRTNGSGYVAIDGPIAVNNTNKNLITFFNGAGSTNRGAIGATDADDLLAVGATNEMAIRFDSGFLNFASAGGTIRAKIGQNGVIYGDGSGLTNVGAFTGLTYVTNIGNASFPLVSGSNSVRSLSAGTNVVLVDQGGTNVQINSTATGTAASEGWTSITDTGITINDLPRNGAKKIRLITNTNSVNFHGMEAGSDGDIVYIMSTTIPSGGGIIYPQSTFSYVTNRIFGVTNFNFPWGGVMQFIYNTNTTRWHWVGQY